MSRKRRASKRKRILKIEANDKWIVAFTTSGLLAFMIGLVGFITWLTSWINPTNFSLDYFKTFPAKDFVQLGVGILFLFMAGSLQDTKDKNIL
jgi:hypothetical protein